MSEVRTVVLAVAESPWQAEAVRRLTRAGLVVLRSCADLTELLACTATRAADVVVASAGLLDADALRRLAADGVGVVRIEAGRTDVGDVVGAVRRAEPAGRVTARGSGRVIAVWGPAGGPGSTTLALEMAAERSRSAPVLLVDADVYGGTVATRLGRDRARSGLLAAAAHASGSGLGAAQLAACVSPVAPRFDVLTGLPHGDRWVALRPGVLTDILELASRRGDVVVDCGFDLDPNVGLGPLQRNGATLEALGRAEEVVAVGRGDAVGLERLMRGSEDLSDLGIGLRAVVLNRVSAPDWRQAIAGAAAPVHVLPDEPRRRQEALRALTAGCFAAPAYC